MDRYIQFAAAAGTGGDHRQRPRPRGRPTATAWPSALARRSAGRCPGGRLCGRQRQGPRVARGSRLRPAVPLSGPRAEQPRQRDRREVRRPWAGGGDLDRMHLGDRRHRLRAPADPGRRGRRRDRRRVRVAHLPDLDGLLRPDQGDLAAKRRPGARLAARSTATATASSWARAAPCSCSRRWRLRPARGAHIYCEVAGFASRGQRVPHDRPDDRWPGDDRGDPRRDAPGRNRIPRTSTTSTRTARARSRTTATRLPPTRSALGDHAYEIPISSIKSMIGHSLGGDRRDRDGRLRAGHRHGRGAAHRELGEPGPRVRPRLHAEVRRVVRRSRSPCCRPAAASAASSRR